MADRIFEGLTEGRRIFLYHLNGHIISVWKCFDPEWDNFKYVLVSTENKKANVFDDIDLLFYSLQRVLEVLRPEAWA